MQPSPLVFSYSIRQHEKIINKGDPRTELMFVFNQEHVSEA